jgi:hypothetical protein
MAQPDWGGPADLGVKPWPDRDRSQPGRPGESTKLTSPARLGRARPKEAESRRDRATLAKGGRPASPWARLACELHQPDFPHASVSSTSPTSFFGWSTSQFLWLEGRAGSSHLGRPGNRHQEVGATPGGLGQPGRPGT